MKDNVKYGLRRYFRSVRFAAKWLQRDKDLRYIKENIDGFLLSQSQLLGYLEALYDIGAIASEQYYKFNQVVHSYSWRRKP